ncbi:MAG TPA: FHA domain-containing protein [Candidatus Baltobacteraceae bacterium]|nr:FHA domain-containing protein [Candidatus Baltobacteraceae bacterium]
MNPAVLRIGSLEILGALAAFGAVISRFRPGAVPQPRVREVTVGLTVQESPARGGRRNATVTIGEGEQASIGRSSDAAVGILDPEVSRSHAALTLTKGVLYLADSGSSNGTFLNGKRVGPGGIEVFAGDVIDVGTTRITVNDLVSA